MSKKPNNLCLRKIFEHLEEKQVNSTPLLTDNTYANKLAKNPKFHYKKKHINTKYHFIRYHVESKTIHLRHCLTNDKIANIFTDALGRKNLEIFVMMVGFTNSPSYEGDMLTALSSGIGKFFLNM